MARGGAPVSEHLIRRYRPGDEVGIVALLGRIFGDAPGFLLKDVERWRYKFERCPAGFLALVATDAEGVIVGHYGAQLSQVWAHGEELSFAQSCDTCTDPAVRRGLHRPGLFVRMAQAYESTFAQPPHGQAVMYGLPIPEAYVVGARYIDYWMLRTQPVLVSRGGVGLPPVARGLQIDHVRGFTEEMDHWCGAWREHYPFAQVRDSAFLNWRFRDHPQGEYFVGIARTKDAGDFRGYAVYRRGFFLGREVGLVMDWFVPPDDEEAAANLLGWLAWRTGSEDGLHEIVFLCPPSSRWFGWFQGAGFEVETTSYVMIGRPFHRDLEPGDLRDHWYYTLADFDVL